MRFLGLQIKRAPPRGIDDGRGRGWFGLVREPFAGAWQSGVEVKPAQVVAHHAIFSCMTRIAADISKLRIKLVAQDRAGFWSETDNPAYSPVLRKPNGFQNRIQFVETWVLSRLGKGNAYILKARDGRGVVNRLYVLDPNRVKPLVSDGGDVFYELQADNLAGVGERVTVPAREIIHDRYNCLYHPLVGISPIYAAGLAATHGLAMQNNQALFFENGSKPGGLLVTPGTITQEQADRLRSEWEANYGGKKRGRVAVIGNGLKYEQMSVDPVDAQLVEQLRWTAEVVCSTFHMPPYKVGIGQAPAVTNVQALNLEYYSTCLQPHIEAIELCLDEGLATGERLGTEFDLDNLLRMDSAAQFEVARNAKGILTLDEIRRKVDHGPIEGGATIYLQQQDHSLAAIAARDARLIAGVPDPAPSPALPPPAPPASPEEVRADVARRLGEFRASYANTSADRRLDYQQSDHWALLDYLAGQEARLVAMEARAAPAGEPGMIYRGTYEPGRAYAPGEVVTWSGSMWHCDKATDRRPGTGEDWTLAVKRGRDARAPGKRNGGDQNDPA